MAKALQRRGLQMKTWLLLDCNYLAWRAFHSTGALRNEGGPTGVLYGFLRNLYVLQSELLSNRFVFCFDYGKSKREGLYPDYKISRKKRYESMSEEELEPIEAMRNQLELLRTTYLDAIGYRNVLFQKGYEADDIIAKICLNLPKGDKAVIVSADQDMYQLLWREQRTIWDPFQKKMTTHATFSSTWKISPKNWAEVKAIAGCKSDDIKGIRGIGEKKAAAYLQGESTKKDYDKIVADFPTVRSNLELTTLPFPGTKKVTLQEDEVTKDSWVETVVTKLKFVSLKRMCPSTSHTFGGM
jgi:DNA polymerase-1